LLFFVIVYCDTVVRYRTANEVAYFAISVSVTVTVN